MPHPPPATRESALAWARATSATPAAVRPFPHPGFEADATAGGFAFVDDTTLYVVCHGGGRSVGLLTAGRAARERIDEQWAANRHRFRELSEDELGPWQRAALTAVRAGTTVADLPAADRAGVTSEPDRDHADRIWIDLRRAPDPLRALAGDDMLMRPPEPGRRRTHPCPLCGLPARHHERYPRTVCDDCWRRTTDSTGRRIQGFNTSMSGGFVAHHVTEDGATEEVCSEVTRSGRCWVDGHPCSIGEAYAGGVVVQAS